MKETLEMRIPEEYASRYLHADQGRLLGDSIRAIVVDTSSALYSRIAEIATRFYRERGAYFYSGWIIRRSYSRPELEAAEVFKIQITSTFEPEGEACGTQYDESSVCAFCRAGRRQVSELILDLRKTPRTRDIARTIADEWIVSQRFAELLVNSGVTGLELKPVRHKARYQDDPIDPRLYPSGLEQIRRAEAAGYAFGSWEYYVWLNRPEQGPLTQRLIAEHVASGRMQERKRASPLPVWYQLVIVGPAAKIAEQTAFGIKPFYPDVKGEFRCPLGHVLGLNMLSEAYITRPTMPGADIAVSSQLVGLRQGVLVPAPLLLISPRLYRIMQDEKIRGYRAEVAHLV